MNDSQFRHELEAFLDGQRDEKQFLQSLTKAQREIVRRERIVQQEIDRSLVRQFATEQRADLNRRVAESVKSQFASSPTQSWAGWWKLALAAMLLVVASIAVVSLVKWAERPGPVFQARHLTQIYLETVERGFKPYYRCDDPQRFAQVFQQRQGVPLQLAELPDGYEMLGISYLGGFSRQTTAMLARVDQREVIVFVDVQRNFDPQLASNKIDNLHMLVENRDGLIFLEVTPYENKRISSFMKKIE